MWAPIPTTTIYKTSTHTKAEEKFLWEYCDVKPFIFKIQISKLKIYDKGEVLASTERVDDIFRKYNIV